MKKLLLVLLFPALVQAQKKAPVSKAVPKTKVAQQQGFTINGSIAGIPEGTVVILTHPSNPANRVATGVVKGGKFTLRGQTPYADIYQLSITGYPTQLDLFLQNEPITIRGSIAALSDVKISGSTLQADYKLYETRFNPLKSRLNDLNNSLRALPAGTSRDSLIALFEIEKTKVAEQVDLFVKDKPSSPVTSFILLLTSQVAGDVAALETRFDKLTADAKTTFYASQLEKIIYDAKNPRIGTQGTMAVDFSQPDTASKPVSLSSFKGKYVLVDFWASWCKPCRMENPAVVNAYNKFHDKNFTVLGISLDQSKENWLRAIQDDNLTWTHVSDLKYWQNEAAQLYGIGSIPANMLIDPSGKIIARDLRGEALTSVLEGLLK